MLSAASSALVASARPALRVSRTSAARTARRVLCRPRAFSASGEAFWDKMVAKASGKSGVTTETAVFALG